MYTYIHSWGIYFVKNIWDMIKVNPSVMNKFIFLIDRFMNIKKYIEMKYNDYTLTVLCWKKCIVYICINYFYWCIKKEWFYWWWSTGMCREHNLDKCELILPRSIYDSPVKADPWFIIMSIPLCILIFVQYWVWRFM